MRDIFGKSVGMPVSELLGGSTGIPTPMISSIYAGDPEDMRHRVAEHRARGYLGHSIKIGALDCEGGPGLDAERIAASLADKRPGEYFIVDANGGLIPETALRMLRMLPPDLNFVLEAWRETVSLRQRCPYPIIVDELAQQDEDITGPSPTTRPTGSDSRFPRQADKHREGATATSFAPPGLAISVQETAGSAIVFAAIAHLGATVPPRYLRCVLNCQDMLSVDTARFDFLFKDGGVLPSDLPGLGLDVNKEVLGAP